VGICDAAHEQTDPQAPNLVVSRLSCSLAGEPQLVRLVPGTRVREAYGQDEVVELFRCGYGLNPAYRDRMVATARLTVSGMDASGEVRVVELPDHPFFVATLFLPQHSSQAGAPHPLIVAYLKAAEAL
jgi:CTP synthase (UTP-ammonia lyase)